ncbi:MAG: hypothetical protein CMK09_14245 [Ponticaulis sp.]|nr:hypothetical protein [Ponticaulis sp.]
MSDIFQEVDEAVAQDRLSNIWGRFKYVIFGAIAALILGVGGWEFYSWQKDKAQDVAAEAFYEAQIALDSNDYVAAEALFREIHESDSPFAEMAGHYLALTQFVGMGDRNQAFEVLKSTGRDDDVFSQAALIKAAYLKADDLEMAALEELLAPIRDNLDSPYLYLADEILAAKAFQTGDLDEARRRYNRIAGALEASDVTKNRATQAVAVLDAMKEIQGTAQ